MPPVSTAAAGAAISGWTIAYYTAMIALTEYGLTRPQPKVPDASVVTGNAPTASEGRPIPVAFGTVLFRDPNIVWFGETGTVPIKSKGAGKK
jgi:hypothetical protein